MQPERGFEPGRPPPPMIGPPSAATNSMRADRSWIPAGALLAAHLAVSAFDERSLAASIALGLLTAVLLFVLVVVHTLGHLAAGLITRSPRGTSRLYVFGDVSEAPRRPIAAFAGPVTSGVVGAALLFLSTTGSFSGWAEDVVRLGGWASLALGAINLLPGLPLDGGHLLASLTRRRRLAMRIGQLFGVAAAGAGIWLVVEFPAMVEDTAFGLWLLLAGIFVLVEGRSTGTAVPRVPLDGQTAGAWARPFAGRVKADDPVPLAGGPYAVSDGTRLAGVLSVGGPPNVGKPCREAMVPWTSDLGVRSTTPLREALDRLAADEGQLVVVVDEKGIVRGVLDEEAVRTHLVT